MNCEILSTLYIRSNGDVPCDDDAGETILLGQLGSDPTNCQIVPILNNARYTHIRAALQAGRMPWPDTCPSCAFFRPYEPYTDQLAEKRIRKMQIEPSLACSLRCPGCSNGVQIKVRPKPFVMTLEIFAAVLQGLKQAEFTIDEIEYCGQGEPLLNPRFPDFVHVARGLFPNTRQRLITSGNAAYWKATGGQRLDEIFVSCDGIVQHSYEQYRVRGRLDRVIQFMRDIPKEIQGQSQVLVWKYILFEFNDSDEEIYQAQQLAQDLGVHTLLFVFTHSAYRSHRYTAENVASFPFHFPNVTTNATPIHYQESPRPILPDGALSIVDEVGLVDDRLHVTGWVLSHVPITAIELSIDGLQLGYAELGLPRPDVLVAHPAFANANSGFAFNGVPEQIAAGVHDLGITLMSPAGPLWHTHKLYDLS